MGMILGVIEHRAYREEKTKKLITDHHVPNSTEN